MEDHAAEDRIEHGEPTLYCPKCSYPLVGVEEAGLSLCPECGEPLDFEELRSERFDPRSLGTPWQMFWRVMTSPRRFFRAVTAKPYNVRVSELYSYDALGLEVGLLGGTGLCGLTWVGTWIAGRSFPGCCVATVPLFWGLLLWAAHRTAGPWMRFLLGKAGHGDANRGQHRVMYFSSIVYVPMGLALCLVMVTLAAAQFAPEVLARLVLLAALGVHCLLWLLWAWIIMRAFEAETCRLGTIRPQVALLNPALVVALAPWGIAVLLTVPF